MKEKSKFIQLIYNQQKDIYQRKAILRKKNQNRFFIFLLLITILSLIGPNISLLNTRRILISNSSYILLRSSNPGFQNILSQEYTGGYPDKIYLDNTLIEGAPTNTIDLINNNSIIKLEWNDNIIDCKNMFKDLNNIKEIDLSNFDSSLVNDTSYMFSGCQSLTSINLDNFTTSSVNNMNGMFLNCISLLTINLTSFDTSLVTNMQEFLLFCVKLTSIDVSNFNTSLVTNMAGMFRGNYNLKYLDLSNFDTSKVINMFGMFGFCRSLTSLNLTSFDTSNVKIFTNLFNDCRKLTEINIKNFNTSSANDIQGMISYCTKLTKLDISNFNTKNIINMDSLFNECNNLESVNLSNFDTSNVGSMQSLFNNCQKLTSIDLSSFNTSKVINMKNMFQNCISLNSINLSNFNTNKCIDFSNMFYDCKNLTYLYFPFFYETNETLLDNFLDGTKEELSLCFKITNKSRLYQLYENKFIKNCLIYEEIQTTHIAMKGFTDIQISSGKINSFILTEMVSYSYDNNYLNNYNTQINNIISRYLNISLNIEEINEKINYENETNGVLIRFTSTFYLKNHTYENKTSIDLGNCENILKDFYNISYNYTLYILLSEVAQEGMKIPKIGYELFDINEENNLVQLNLSLCQNEKIEISIPVNINEDIDKYNSSSGYYNDICYPSTSNYGTDICLNDRREGFIDNNLTLCEENCDLIYYDYTFRKAKCSCDIKINLPLVDDIKINKEKLKNNFIDINNIANLKFMKCYKIVFKKENIKNNYGFYIQGFIFCLFLTCLFLFYFKYYKLFLEKIKNIFLGINNNNKIILEKENSINNQNTIKDDTIKVQSKKTKKIKRKKRKRKAEIDNKIIIVSNLEQNKTNSIINNKDLIQNNVNNNLDYNDLELNSLPYNEALLFDKRTYFQYYISLLKKYHLLLFSFYPNNKDYNSRIIKMFLFFFFFSSHFTINALFYSDSTMHQIYEDEGTFNFIYQIPQILYSSILSAIIGSLIKFLSLSERNIIKVKEELKKNSVNIDDKIKKLYKTLKIKFALFFTITTIILIIFTFYTKTDYNSRILKIILFLLSFTLFYTVNALFFTDSTMHQIYEDEGAFNFVYQIPQILYSTIISTVIKFIISFLSLTEKNFSKINNNCKTKKEAKEEMNKIFSSGLKKFIAFFSINFILLIIFWYYLSCFCAVYKNTQLYLLKDTLITFATSLLYPFALNLIPAILRIPAIKSKKKCLYIVSTYAALI